MSSRRNTRSARVKATSQSYGIAPSGSPVSQRASVGFLSQKAYTVHALHGESVVYRRARTAANTLAMASFSEHSRSEARCSYCIVQVPRSPQALMWMEFVAQPQRYSRLGGVDVQSDVSWHASSSWAEELSFNLSPSIWISSGVIR